MFQRYDDLENTEEEKPKRSQSSVQDKMPGAEENLERSVVTRLIARIAPQRENPNQGRSTHPIEGFTLEQEKPKRSISSHPMEGFAYEREKPKRGIISREGIDQEYLQNAFVLNTASWKFLDGKSPTIPGNGGLVLVFFGLLLALILTPIGIKDIVETNERHATGRTTTATVLGKRVSRGKSTSYYLTYEFRTHTEKVIQREESVSGGLYGVAGVGSNFDVVYAADNPSNARLVQNGDPNTWIILWVGVAFSVPMVIGGMMMWQRLRRLNQQGRLIPGRIVTCTGSSSKNGYTVTAKYQFQTPDGQILSGSVSSQRNDLRRVNLPQYNVPVIVIWDGGKTHRML